MIIKYFKILLLATTLCGVAACSSNGPTPEFVGENEVPGGVESPAPSESDDDSEDNQNNDAETVSDLIDGLSIAGADSEAFIVPSGSDQDKFQALWEDLLAGDNSGHDSTLNDLKYELLTIDLDDESAAVWALRELGNAGGGTFLINPTTDSNLVLEVPHPLHDSNTLDEAVHLFQTLGARALFIAGTHRCANSEISGCSGSITACDGELRVSDVGHATQNFFHVAHTTTNDTMSSSIFLSVHGFSQGTDEPAVILSNGSESDVGFFATVNRLRDEIDDRLTDPEFAVSCNLRTDDDFGLCGTSNVQGRYTNGSSDACTTSASQYSGRFIHMEQAGFLRDPASDWSTITDALSELF